MTVRNWNDFIWDDGTLWGGTPAATGALRWGVEVDWDGDGAFDGSNEAAYLIHIKRERGRTSYLKPAGDGFNSIQPGRCTITLDNTSGRFDAWNSASDLYPNVNYGKEVRIRVLDQLTGVLSDYFHGVIVDIQPNEYGSEPQVMITIEDGLRYLLSYSARVALHENIAPDIAIGLVLDSVAWPRRWGRDLDSSVDSIRYYWASGNKSAASVLEDITQSFLGYFFIKANGEARFVKRQNALTSVISVDQTQLLKDIGNPQPFVNFRNVVRLKAHPRTPATTGVIYQLLGNTPAIQPGASVPLELFANYAYNGISTPAKNVITPAGTTDFLANTVADGSGTDKTANITVVLYDFGDTAKLTITNNSGVVVYLTKLQIRGDAIYESNVSDITYPADPATVVMPREFVADLIWQQDLNVAQDFSTLLQLHFNSQLKTPVIPIEARPELQFGVDLFDIVTCGIAKLGIPPSSFRVGGISDESIAANCQALRTRFYLEPYISADAYMQWDTNSVWDTSTVFGA